MCILIEPCNGPRLGEKEGCISAVRRAGSPAVVSAAMKEAFVCRPQVPSASRPTQHHLLPARGGCVPLASGTRGDAARPASVACGNAASPKPHQGSCALDNCLFCLALCWEGRSAVRFLFYFYPQIKFSVRFGLYFFSLVCPTTESICFVF